MPSEKGRMPESHTPGEFHYHYDREKREQMLSEETKKVLKKGKFLTLNRRNLIILADIGIIILFTMIFVPFSMNGKKNASFDGGYRAVFKASEFDSRALLSVKISSESDIESQDSMVRVLFSMEGQDMTVEQLDLLPVSADEPRYLRAEFPIEGADRIKVFAEVEIDGKSRKLSSAVRVQ